ncbi:hypothetical protein N7493_011301 [Penicillium malachiteum]|uniref:Uncharacterized protein n=1 Tax=Penicillium malachiteum TaxID=1324776 RepID=A0AAD6HBV9_9EURO|nr:hypothetical protein N7493_011301 [Penicillium malachiteum]
MERPGKWPAQQPEGAADAAGGSPAGKLTGTRSTISTPAVNQTPTGVTAWCAGAGGGGGAFLFGGGGEVLLFGGWG